VARPLEPQQEARLTASLERLYGRQVQLQVDVDPAVLGGISVRVGDEVLDGTVQRNLEAVRRTLAR
jgi:F-type H+-transporting ATPase subunit delta